MNKFWLITIRYIYRYKDEFNTPAYFKEHTETLATRGSLAKFINDAPDNTILINSVEITEEEWKDFVNTEIVRDMEEK